MDFRPSNLLNPEENPEAPTAPPRRRLKPLPIALVCLAAVVGLYGLQQYALGGWPHEGIFYEARLLQPKKWGGFFRSVKNFIFAPDNVVEGQAENRINILLLGMGGPGHDGPYLTDTNIILSIKPSAQQVAMVSVPRDLVVKLPKYGWRKINHANSFGELESAGSGGEFTRQVFEETFGIAIPYYLRVDFKAFTDLIDEVGCIDIKVPEAFTDPQFPGPNHTYQTVSFSAGFQHMDGRRALVYARSRHGGNGQGSDFARSRRQQQVLSALRAKLLSFDTYLNPIKIQGIWETLATHISTNLDFGQLMYLGNLGREIPGDIISLVLDDSANGFLQPFVSSETGAYLLGPKDGSFEAIKLAIQNIFEPPTATSTLTTVIAPAPTVFPHALTKIEVQNGTWQIGLASKTKDRLEKSGFLVPTIGNSFKRPILATALYVINPAASLETINSLAKFLELTPAASIPVWLAKDYDDPATEEQEAGQNKYTPTTDVLIILGEDFRE